MKITRRSKRELVRMFAARNWSLEITVKLATWMQLAAELEIEGERSISAGKSLAEFVAGNYGEILDLPFRS